MNGFSLHIEPPFYDSFISPHFEVCKKNPEEVSVRFEIVMHMNS